MSICVIVKSGDFLIRQCGNENATDTSDSEEHHAPKLRRLEIDADFDINKLERDPGLRPQIWKYPSDKRDEVRRAYINFGPNQPMHDEYPKSVERNSHSFQSSWYGRFASWLEYSKAVDGIFGLPCFLFQKEDGPSGSNAFTFGGFRTWNKVGGKTCSLMAHVGKDHNSAHHIALLSWSYLTNQSGHISNEFENSRTQEILDNRLRLKTSIEVAIWLAFQSCAFRGNDESDSSSNRGNFIELLRNSANFFLCHPLPKSLGPSLLMWMKPFTMFIFICNVNVLEPMN
ncbi:hypothetical protein QQ045_024351 [Rhodiola kirilowii]